MNVLEGAAAATGPAPLAPVLLDGLRQLSVGEAIPFRRYTRRVLPLDGFVFWLRADCTEVEGSLHVQATRRQLEDETIAVHRVVLTTPTEVEALREVAPDTLWVGEARGVRFSFSESGPTYRSSGLFHYVGDAVYPALASQLVDDGAGLSDATLVVSNSLPAWLLLQRYVRPWLHAPNPDLTLYPSYLVPANLTPPYGVVHVEPGYTESLQGTAQLGPLHNRYQLARDRVRVTLYGCTNDQAMAFLDLVYAFSEDTDVIGMAGSVVVRDEKRTQAELGVLAMKKSLTFEVTYYQAAIRNAAQQLIEQVITTYLPAAPGA